MLKSKFKKKCINSEILHKWFCELWIGWTRSEMLTETDHNLNDVGHIATYFTYSQYSISFYNSIIYVEWYQILNITIFWLQFCFIYFSFSLYVFGKPFLLFIHREIATFNY